MQILSATKDTKATLQKKPIEKRNLFGLGVTSLIAACGTDGAGDDGLSGGEPVLPGKVVEAEAASSDVESAPSAGENRYHLDDNATGDFVDSDKIIYWNTAETTPDSSTTPRTTINGDTGKHDPAFLKLGGTDNKYDMVIRSQEVNRPVGGEDQGAIYIVWDIADYYDPTTNADLNLANPEETFTSGLLTIYGAMPYDQIGTYAPEFLHLDGNTKYDMVIRWHDVNKPGGNFTREGAIYILWNISDYNNNNTPKNVVLDSTADHGSLSIYGGSAAGKIGTHAPEFLKIGGEDSYDMVIRSEFVDSNKGAIYILWDVADYTGNKTIDLGDLDGITTFMDQRATAGSLAIYGATADRIGSYAPKFFKIGGEDSYDMVIRSEWVDSNKGAIYILWDVADYYKDTSDQIANKSIDLGAADATSGLLTIYGRAAGANLGSDVNNILYGSDDGNKTLTDIDGDGTIDIALTDGQYTYIFFGDKIATTTGAGVDEKVASKTIDLAQVNADGFFSYDFDGAEPAPEVARVGYRFAENDIKTDLAEVQTAYTAANPVSLSDTDADLGVWDIA